MFNAALAQISKDEIKAEIKRAARRMLCEQDHLYFTRHFFKARQSIKFRVNWHHRLISDEIQMVIDGTTQNLLINIAPGSSKTEIVVINLIARGLAINPRARFLHLSGSDTLALLNSSTARDLITSDAYQDLWPMKIADDAKSKKRWNVEIDGQQAGGVYATSLGGQITGFRAGHMTEGFQGAIIIDDPNKPEDAFSKPKLEAANRKLLTTVQSRKANPETPIIIIMQRVAESDVSGFVKDNNLDGKWRTVNIPALIDDEIVKTFNPKYQFLIEPSEKDDKGRYSYWPYKEPLTKLLTMERGDGTNQTGARISRHVFSSQYQQKPRSLGGNIIKGEYLVRYKELPKIKYRIVFADTAQKTKEHNDFSVFEEWGMGDDGLIYLIDMIRGKWESPELRKRATAFWAKCKARDIVKCGQLRKLIVEDKSSGTDLIQTLKLAPHNIPVFGIERNKDKFTRVNDALPYIESSQICIPEDAPFTNDFIEECESFTADDTHDFDDQVDPMLDAIMELLSNGNKLKHWEQLGAKSQNS
jgi:predicted phage terminase large subunit-like protein